MEQFRQQIYKFSFEIMLNNEFTFYMRLVLINISFLKRRDPMLDKMTTWRDLEHANANLVQ